MLLNRRRLWNVYLTSVMLRWAAFTNEGAVPRRKGKIPGCAALIYATPQTSCSRLEGPGITEPHIRPLSVFSNR